MTASLDIRKGVEQDMQRQREIKMYGCTEAQLRESVESSITFEFSGPAMVAASLLSDCQEMMAYGPYDSATLARIQESQRQTLNQAKFILFEYVMQR
jgi:hypothetical protein